MFKNRQDITRNAPKSDPAKWVNVFQIWNMGEYAGKASFDEIVANAEFDKPCYQFSLLGEECVTLPQLTAERKAA